MLRIVRTPARFRRFEISLNPSKLRSRDSYPNIGGRCLGCWVGRVRAADSKGLGAAVVALFSLLAERSPLLVVIDDLHWADTTSLEAISFANRRLDHERALVLAAAHDGELDPIESMPTFVVAGLSPFEVARLFEGVVESRNCRGIDARYRWQPSCNQRDRRSLVDRPREGREPLPRFVPIGVLIRQRLLQGP